MMSPRVVRPSPSDATAILAYVLPIWYSSVSTPIREVAPGNPPAKNGRENMLNHH